MPLNSKGKKIKTAMEKQYGKKKGQSVFYAMENSGKLKNILKAKGGKDASRADFGGSNPSPGDTGGEGGYGASTSQFTGKGDGGNQGGGGFKQNIAKLGTSLIGKAFDLPGLGPVLGLAKKGVQTVQQQARISGIRNTDPLGGEMLTTSTMRRPYEPVVKTDQGGVCPDGSAPPCKTPLKQSFDDGGEIVISSNVDKSLL